MHQAAPAYAAAMREKMMPSYSWDAPKFLPALPPGLATNPAWTVAANEDGHFEVFAIGSDNSIWHIWQLAPNSPSWSMWNTFGAPPKVALSATSMMALKNADGRIELFARDSENNVWHIWQLAPNANWDTSWSSLGRPIDPNGTNDEYVTTGFLDDAGCLQVVSQNLGSGDGNISSIGQLRRNSNWQNGWTSLGVPPTAFSWFVVSPLDRTLSNSVYVAAETLASGAAAPVYVSQKSGFVEGAGNWSGWRATGWTTPQGPDALMSFIGVNNQDKHVELIGVDNPTGNLWHTWQLPDGATWSGEWHNLGHPPNGGVNGFDVALDARGCLMIASWQEDGFLWTIGQTAQNNGWGNWYRIQTYDLSGYFVPEIRLLPQQDGLLTIFARISGNQLMYINQTELKS